MARPLAIDLYCGLGGWTEGLLAEGYDVVGFDIERHVYGAHRYPAQLVLQDVLTLHGSQFREAALVVASPPCPFFSYTSMPWTRAKRLAAEVRADPTRFNAELALFRACFRIQREASAAAGRHIPIVVENVKGAQQWVGRSRWNFGSYHLWGDVPALMPMIRSRKNSGGSWFAVAHNTTSGTGNNPDSRNWHRDPMASSRGRKRAQASALVAMIPLPLARHVGRCFYPSLRQEKTGSKLTRQLCDLGKIVAAGED